MSRREGIGALAALCAATVGLAAPAAAGAAVDVRADRVVVTGDGARAVVDRSPFRLTIQDRGGRTVLQQAAARLPLPQPSTSPQPEPGGVNVLPEAAPYAPFVFEIGGE